jgi:hypothetical protein
MRAEAFLRFGSLSSQKYKQWSRRKKRKDTSRQKLRPCPSEPASCTDGASTDLTSLQGAIG